jgi:DNA helicase-2/ATP-dependent DNA helicase PcrA
MTRARKMLHICHVKERYNKELEPSRFIGELLKG